MKNTKGKLNKMTMVIIGIILVVLLLVIISFINDDTNIINKDNEIITELPAKVDNEKIRIESVFQYTGINPDYEYAECTDIGAIQLMNISDEYLETAHIAVELSDGTELQFIVEDIPSGATVLAFEVENKSFQEGNDIADIDYETSYLESVSFKEDELKLTIEGYNILVENISSNDLSNLTVKYHCVFDGLFFGGQSFKGNISELKVNNQITVDASDCFLGEIAIVNVVD